MDKVLQLQSKIYCIQIKKEKFWHLEVFKFICQSVFKMDQVFQKEFQEIHLELATLKKC